MLCIEISLFNSASCARLNLEPMMIRQFTREGGEEARRQPVAERVTPQAHRGHHFGFPVYFKSENDAAVGVTSSLKLTIFCCGRLHSGPPGGIQLITIFFANNPTTIAVL